MTAARRSQNDQILDVLADGNWHTSRQIHQHVFCVLHSRINELRDRGYLIEHRGGGAGADLHEYRLTGWPLNTPSAAGPVGDLPAGAADGVLSGRQLTVYDALGTAAA